MGRVVLLGDVWENALTFPPDAGYVLPYMSSLVAKQKGNRRYYYVVESARVNGQPRIVQQTYLGTAERLAALVKDRTAPLPLSATVREFGLPGALWLAAQRTRVFDVLTTLWPPARGGPSAAHYLLLAAIHRICQPGPKTDVAEWYRHSILAPVWGFPYADSPLAPTPAAEMLIDGLGGKVAGATGYLMWNDMLYGEAGAYSTLSKSTQKALNTFEPDENRIDGAAACHPVCSSAERWR